MNAKTKEDVILNEFKKHGEIISIKLIKNLITNEKKGYGFLEYKHFSSAYDSYKTSQNLILDNQKIIVDFERGRLQKNWKPRRIGGGLGGQKSSGQMRFEKNIFKKSKKYH